MSASTGSARADDAKHSLLSKARPISQTSLEAFLASQHDERDRPRLPRSEFGTYTVQEVDVRSALTDLDMPGEAWSLNPYTGCSHDCAYCYVPDVAHLERDRWGGYVVVKRNLPRRLSRELKRKPAKPVFLSSATDPYQPAEAEHRITRRSLELIAREGWPVSILTRSPLVERDLDLITELDQVRIGMSIPTVDDEARRMIEPAAPPIEGRLATIQALDDAGLEPYINLAPAYPLTSGTRAEELAKRFADAGAHAVYAGRWRYLDTVLPVLEDRVDGTVYEDIAHAVDDDAYYERMFAALNGAFRRAGVAFEVM